MIQQPYGHTRNDLTFYQLSYSITFYIRAARKTDLFQNIED